MSISLSDGGNGRGRERKKTSGREENKIKNSPVALPRLLDAHVHDLALHVLLDLGLRVIAPALGEPVPEDRRLRLQDHDEVEPALGEEVAAVEVDDAASRGERFLEGIDDLSMFCVVLVFVRGEFLESSEV